MANDAFAELGHGGDRPMIQALRGVLGCSCKVNGLDDAGLVRAVLPCAGVFGCDGHYCWVRKDVGFVDRGPDAAEEVFVNLTFLFQGVVVKCGGLILLCDFAFDVVNDFQEYLCGRHVSGGDHRQEVRGQDCESFNIFLGGACVRFKLGQVFL